MKIRSVILIVTLCVTKMAWAGFGAPAISDINVGSELQGHIPTGGVAPPLVSIGASGSGQIVFVRNFISNSIPITTAHKLYAQSIDEFNQLQNPVLLAEAAAQGSMLVPASLNYAENGNAMLFYTVNFSSRDIEDQGWTVYYDAQTGWRQPVLLPFNPRRVKLLIDNDGLAYALLRPSNSDLYSLYHYQSDNTWSLLNDSIEDSVFGMGADGRIYRIYFDTQNIRYISFFNISNNQWQTPIVLNQDQDGNFLSDIPYIHVTDGGDIIALEYSLAALPSTRVILSVRKYEADSNAWQNTSDTLEIPYEGITPLLIEFTPTRQNNNESSFIGLLSEGRPSNDSSWETVHYSEQSGWQSLRTLHDLQSEEGYVALLPTKNYNLSNILGGFNYFSTDNTGNALAVFCRNNCTDLFAKLYNNTNGWSNELYLPALASGNEDSCYIENNGYWEPSPQVAVHANGKLIAASGFHKEPDRSSFTNHLVTVTGDILTATSDTTCPENNTNTEPKDPGNTNPVPSDPGSSDPGSSDPGSTDPDAGDRPSGSDEQGVSSGGALSFYSVLLLLLLIRRLKASAIIKN